MRPSDPKEPADALWCPDSPALAALVESVRAQPVHAAVVLGSGMGVLTERLTHTVAVPFADVPGLASPSVAGHAGRLTVGTWAGKRALVFAGRLHRYEGHNWAEVERPIRLALALGARVLVLTNAAGGIHPALAPGSLMAVRDHLEVTYPYCWRRPGPGGLGGPRPSPYAPRLLDLLDRAAQQIGVGLYQGVYGAVTGPSYETPAEIRALRTWGADAVGMSTAREVQCGHDAGAGCAAVSCITNRAAGLGTAPVNHEEVLRTAAEQGRRLGDLLERFLALL